MKNLPKMMSNLFRMAGGGGAISDSPTFTLSMKEYEDIGITVGDTVTIEITKSDIMEI
jgi:predicted lysophospholipase L1 biosynthesis ABC-type transport system permease subunit